MQVDARHTADSRHIIHERGFEVITALKLRRALQAHHFRGAAANEKNVRVVREEPRRNGHRLERGVRLAGLHLEPCACGDEAKCGQVEGIRSTDEHDPTAVGDLSRTRPVTGVEVLVGEVPVRRHVIRRLSARAFEQADVATTLVAKRSQVRNRTEVNDVDAGQKLRPPSV